MLDFSSGQLLLVDDDPVMLERLAQRAAEDGWSVHRSGSAAQAIRDLREVSPEVVCTRLEMATLSGQHVVRAVSAVDEGLPVVVYTNQPDLETAVDLMRAGAFDCVGLPIEHLDELMGVLQRASQHVAMVQEKRGLQRELEAAQASLTRHLEQEAVIRQRALDSLTVPLHGVMARVRRLISAQDEGPLRDELMALLDDLLQVQTVLDTADHDSTVSGTNAVHLTEFQVQELVEFARSAVLSDAHDKGLELGFVVPGDLPSFRADTQKLRQVLVYLLGFLIDRNREGAVQVAVSVVSRGAGPWSLRFEVGDHETVLGPESDDRLAQYLPGHNATIAPLEHVNLSMAARMVSLLGGVLSLHEQRSVGSVFWFEIGLLQAKRDLSAPQVHVAPADVLVMEPNPVVRRSVINELTKLGMRCAAASTADQAVQLLDRAEEGGRAFEWAFLSLAVAERTGLDAWFAEHGAPPAQVYLARAGEVTDASGEVLMRPPCREDLVRVLSRNLEPQPGRQSGRKGTD